MRRLGAVLPALLAILITSCCDARGGAWPGPLPVASASTGQGKFLEQQERSRSSRECECEPKPSCCVNAEVFCESSILDLLQKRLTNEDPYADWLQYLRRTDRVWDMTEHAKTYAVGALSDAGCAAMDYDPSVLVQVREQVGECTDDLLYDIMLRNSYYLVKCSVCTSERLRRLNNQLEADAVLDSPRSRFISCVGTQAAQANNLAALLVAEGRILYLEQQFHSQAARLVSQDRPWIVPVLIVNIAVGALLCLQLNHKNIQNGMKFVKTQTQTQLPEERRNTTDGAEDVDSRMSTPLPHHNRTMSAPMHTMEEDRTWRPTMAGSQSMPLRPLSPRFLMPPDRHRM